MAEPTKTLAQVNAEREQQANAANVAGVKPAAKSAADVLQSKVKDAQVADAKAAVANMGVQKAGTVLAAQNQQGASPFMPGAPAATVASAGVLPSAGVQVIPPVSHADDITRAASEQAVLDAQRPASDQPTKPKALSSAHVMFQSNRPNLGASGPKGIIRFTDGYAQTNNEEEIKYLTDNAAHFGIKRV